ncbi:hypothetical protein GGF32_008051 [Allomyces javanicus]|nr:hypothetical protein GGF32_008051 [Allomyces javanicus]
MLAGSPPNSSCQGTPGAAPPPRLPRLTIHEQQLLLERAAVVLRGACIPTAEHMKTAALGLIHGGSDAPLISDMIAVLAALSTDLRKLWALYDPALRAAAHAIEVDLESRAEEERSAIKAAKSLNVLHEETAAVPVTGTGMTAVVATGRGGSIAALLAQGPGAAETDQEMQALLAQLLADPLGHLLVAPESPFVATGNEHDVITMSDVRIALGLRDPLGLRDKGCAFPRPFDWDLLVRIGVKKRAPPVPECSACGAPRTECACPRRAGMPAVVPQEGTQKVVVVGVRRRG